MKGRERIASKSKEVPKPKMIVAASTISRVAATSNSIPSSTTQSATAASMSIVRAPKGQKAGKEGEIEIDQLLNDLANDAEELKQSHGPPKPHVEKSSVAPKPASKTQTKGEGRKT